MPGGGRRTHDFPRGKPLLLTLTDTAFAGLFVLVLGISVLAFGLDGWRAIAQTFAIFVGYAIARSLQIVGPCIPSSGDRLKPETCCWNRLTPAKQIPDWLVIIRNGRATPKS